MHQMIKEPGEHHTLQEVEEVLPTESWWEGLGWDAEAWGLLDFCLSVWDWPQERSQYLGPCGKPTPV